MQSPLRNVRKAHGFTLQHVAAGVQVNPATLSRIERLEQIPSIELAERLANFFKGEVSEMQILYPARFQSSQNQTENALFNRLRADGDQIFPLGWAMVLQRAAGNHHIADAVAQSAGGVFVSLPEIEEVENADINQRLLEVIEQIGSYSKQIRSAIEDGVVEPHEQAAINDELYMSISKLQEHAALVYKIFCAPEKSDARECAAPGAVAFCVCGETNA